MTIKVLYVQSQEFNGPVATLQASLMRHLPRDRFEVHCAVPVARDGEWCPPAREVLEIPDVAVRPTRFGTPGAGGRLGNALRSGAGATIGLAGLAGYVRRHRIDVVHASEKPRDAVFGVTAAGVGGARSVLHLHVKPAGWMSRPVRTALARASAIVGVSRFVADSAVALGYPAAKVHAVLNGLELESWLQGDGENTTAADRAAVRAEFAMADDAPLLVSASRLFHWKGQHLAIEALPAVTARFPRVVLLVVGADDTTAGGGSSYSADLRRLVDDLGVADNVRFTGWRRDVRRLISAADVFVLPSFEEPFGMVYLEAMALRRPVVGLDNGGTAEVVDHDGSGLLSPPADAAALAANLVRLLADPGLRHRMGQHGHRRVVTSFGSERMTADMVALYERMVPVPRSETRSPRPPGIVDASVGG